MGQYLADLEKAGILTGDKEPATLERLKSQLAAAEDDLVTGNAEVASVDAVPAGRIAALRASSTTRPNTRSPS